MAVITELIDAGLQLKLQGNLGGAIEHFRQLHTTYPDNARIVFELAGAWREFNVPEQALPLYRDLLALPKGQGLPAKDMPRLYTHLGATLLSLGEYEESLTIIDEGLRLQPSYRPLRAWRIFAFNNSGSHQLALLDAVELMLESLAPSRWDVFEADIVAAVKQMRLDLSGEDSPIQAGDAPAQPREDESAASLEIKVDTAERRAPKVNEIVVSEEAGVAAEVDVAVTVVKPAKKTKGSGRKTKKATPPQLGKKAVRIDIGGKAGAAKQQSSDEDPPANAAAFKIPIDED